MANSRGEAASKRLHYKKEHTYNEMRRSALANGWIENIIPEINIIDDGLFGEGEKRLNIEQLDVVMAAVNIFVGMLKADAGMPIIGEPSDLEYENDREF